MNISNTGARRKRGPAIDVRKVQPLFAKYAKDGMTIKGITEKINSELGLQLEPGQLAAKMTQLRQKMLESLVKGKYAKHFASYEANKQDKQAEQLLGLINKSLEELFPPVTRAGKTRAAVESFLAELDLPEFDLPELDNSDSDSEADSDSDSEEI